LRLSKIKLAGFKSFVDPTTIHFPSNLIGIVGPNGCGKSNVIDAVRWVMGESSAKNLRGDSMEDVIFNGSSGRKPVGQASVELIFDNSDGAIGGAYASYAEVAIRRVLGRDGASVYYLNNTRCRRKDITHILLGTGLGPRSYSIIEQGMISRIVEARPEDLRGFLEEAAGISKYKDRRRETEHRIRHTRDNLDRLTDLRDEVTAQLERLKRQARAAERYRELKTEERRTEAELLALRLQDLNSEATNQKAAFGELENALQASIAKQRATEADIEKQRIERTEASDAFNIVQSEYYRVGADIARLEQSVQHRRELRQRQEREFEQADGNLSEIDDHINRDQQELSALVQTLERLGPGLEQASLSQRASASALADAEDGMEKWRESWEAVGEELAEVARVEHVEAAREEHLSEQIQGLQAEQQEVGEQQAAFSFAELEQQIETLVRNEETLKAAQGEAARALESVWGNIQKLREQDQKVSARLDQVRADLQADRGRLASLEALQQAALGQASGAVKGWLKARDIDSNPRLAENLRVATGWEKAVETVLGGYLEAVCVDGLEDVAAAIGDLGEGGVALFDASTPQNSGVSSVDSLASKVSEPAGAQRLLQKIKTADSLGEALRLARSLSADESVITADGVWIGPGWLRVNRSDDPRAGVIQRTEEIKVVTARIQEGSRRADEVEKMLSDTRTRLEQLEDTRTHAQAEATRRQNLYGETKAQLESGRSKLEHGRERAAYVARRLSELGSSLQNAEQSLVGSRDVAQSSQVQRGSLEERRGQLEKNRDFLAEQLAGARERAEADRQLTQDIAIQVESRRSSKESAGVVLGRLHQQRVQVTQRRDELSEQIESALGPIREEQTELEALLKQRLDVEQSLGTARSGLESIEQALRSLDEARMQCDQAVAEAREIADAARLSVREAEVRAEAVQEQFGKTGLDLSVINAELPEEADTPSWEEKLEKIEKRINRLGPINLAAIDEFKQQSERKEYLDAQNADLTEALDTLETAIRKIDRETRARFKDTFDKVNIGLQRLFPQLFGGGHAYLELDGEDLLSSGVTVMARPPGKRNSTIHLLSGGEKALTAVAMVFSIFELNPAPFCLLDEVDAPLDDANVNRFCEIVRSMSEHVQFLLITHNKTTMEMSNQLTGVTMNEPGVSRLVAVDIDEAVQLAAM
jgi:chromosome segregation protein